MPTNCEIFSVLTLPTKRVNYTCINKVFDQLGLTPCLCINFLDNTITLLKYKCGLNIAIEKITSKQLEQLFKNTASLTIDEILPFYL
jgi:hypothetical protein